MTSAGSLPTINFPTRYLPGTTANFVSNEVYVTGLTAAQVWPLLVVPERWASYYDGASDITFPDNDGPQLREGMRFWFTPFKLAPLRTVISELVSPGDGRPARLSWAGQMEQDGKLVIDAMHGFLIQDLPDGRLRLLTQESERGPAAKQVASEHSASLLAAHQSWLEGLVSAARAAGPASA